MKMVIIVSISAQMKALRPAPLQSGRALAVCRCVRGGVLGVISMNWGDTSLSPGLISAANYCAVFLLGSFEVSCSPPESLEQE